MKKLFAVCLSLAVSLACARPALSHELEPEEAGHPLRVTAYILHPVGYVLYHAIFKPAHALISSPGASEVFGHKRDVFDKSSPEADFGMETEFDLGPPAGWEEACPPGQSDAPTYNFQPRRKHTPEQLAESEEEL